MNQARLAAIFDEELVDDRAQFNQLGSQLIELADFVDKDYSSAKTSEEKVRSCVLFILIFGGELHTRLNKIGNR